MAQVINTNVMSLNAQRNLSTSGSSLATSLQRLSSGLRINSAKDDAAGLAISERFTTQIRGLNQAARNANDGISLSQTAEGALGEIGNNLQRIRELAVQSRNATNSASDRQALNAEAQQLLEEIDRVASQTSFNGVNLLDGSFASQAFQIGANQGQTISIDSIVNASSAALGNWTSADTTTDATITVTAANLEAPTDDAGDGSGTFSYAATTVSINGVDVDVAEVTGAASAADARTARLAGLAAAIGGAEGVDAVVNGDGDLVITSSEDITVADAANVATAGLASATVTEVAGSAQVGFATLDISDEAGADNAILAMDAALTAVNTARANMGAVQNRFTSVVANLQTTSENLSASRSRILDADFAAETANMTRAQILQQAGTAILAQANAVPQNVLSLLR